MFILAFSLLFMVPKPLLVLFCCVMCLTDGCLWVELLVTSLVVMFGCFCVCLLRLAC